MFAQALIRKRSALLAVAGEYANVAVSVVRSAVGVSGVGRLCVTPPDSQFAYFQGVT
jgi:hypothetical protein